MAAVLGRGIAMLAVAAGVCAQQAAQRPSFTEFEVAAIKPAAEEPQGRWIRMQTTHEFKAKNHSVKTLIAAAYNLNPKAISGGPAWVESERYDIVAKAPNEIRPNPEEQMAMLRKLLADRFALRFHREERELRVYALTVAKGGPKLKESTFQMDVAGEGPPLLAFVLAPQLVRMPARYATMGEFASVMQRAALEYPVLDRTGLTGRYDFDLEFAPDESVFGGVLGKGSDDPNRPDLFGAVTKQLGLKLEATRGPVQALVIDRVEHPSGN